MTDDSRPAKRIKFTGDSGASLETTVPTQTTEPENPSPKSQAQAQVVSKKPQQNLKNGHKTRPDREKKAGQGSVRTFSQTSVLCAGDKGIFVTSDKGCEKKSLLELHDILQDYFESNGIDASGNPVAQTSFGQYAATGIEAGSSHNAKRSIEADIASELAGLRNTGQSGSEINGDTISKPMQLITLDIPCVSFLRFPTKSSVDPVDVVHRVCLKAAEPGSQQRSRYIKRLTPASSLAKTLKQGLETVSDAILPHHFGPDEKDMVKSVKFAIRPTIRENEQLDRDLIIKPVADRIQELGRNAHKVDLKGYDKAVIVEVYRGWVSMCVVDNTNQNSYQQGYEQLRRFNLAEIYAKR